MSSYQNILEKSGYKVVSMEELEGADAALISGMDQNVTGMQDISISGPVIDASGMSANDILSELKRRLP